MNYKLLKLSLVFVTLSGTLIGCNNEKTSKEHYDAAVSHQNAGELNAAIIEFKNVLKKDPNNVDTRLALGLIYKERGELLGAKKELAYAVEKEQTRRDAIVAYASVLSDLGDIQEVIDLPLLASSLSSEQMIQAYYLRGKSYSRLKELNKGRKAFIKCTEFDIESIYLELCKATLAVLDGELELAEKTLDDVLLQQPKMAEALLLSGSIYSLGKDYVKAADVYQRHIELYSKQIGLVNLLYAEALVNSNQVEKAAIEIDKILETNPLQALANYLKSRILFDQENFELALLHAGNAVKGDQNHFSANLIGGMSAFRQSMHNDSYRMLSRIETKLEGNTLPIIMNVINNLKLGHVAYAAELLERAGQLEKKNIGLFMLAANEFSIAQDHQTALGIFERVQALDPESNAVKYAIGGVKLQGGDISGVDSLYQTLFDPQYSMQSMTLISAAYIKSGRKDELPAIAQQLKEKMPQSPNGWLMAGNLAVNNKALDKAKEEYQQALDLDASNVSALSNLAKIFATKGDFSQALLFVEQALQSYPKELNLIMLKARLIFSETQDRAQAESVIVEAYERFSDDINLIVERALLHAKNGEIKQGLLLLAAISDKEGLSNKYWNSYSKLMIADNRNGEALAIFQQWAQDKPNLPTPLLKQIALTERMRLFDQGLGVIAQGQKDFSHIAEFHWLEVSFLIMAGKADEARSKFNRLGKTDVANMSYRLVKGELLVAEGKYKAGIDELLPVYESSKALRSLRALSAAYISLNQQSKLIIILEKHLKDSPNDTVLRPLLASAYAKLGDNDKARASYEKVLQVQPENPIALNNLAWILYSEGDYHTALKHASKALSIVGNNPQILDTHGVILLKLNKVAQAKTSLEKALLLQPKDFSINAHNAEIALIQGERALAKQLLNKVPAVTEDEKQLYQSLHEQL